MPDNRITAAAVFRYGLVAAFMVWCTMVTVFVGGELICVLYGASPALAFMAASPFVGLLLICMAIITGNAMWITLKETA